MKRTIFTILFFCLVAASCQKEEPTKAIITVYNNSGDRVVGAVVTLSQEQLGPGVNQTNLTSTQTSDYNGETEHVLELEAIMNVDAVLYNNSGNILQTGATVVRFVKGKTVRKDVEIN